MKAVNDHLFMCKDKHKNRPSQITEYITKQGIDKVLLGENQAEKLITYKTSMDHGSSGSPVYNDQGVFGIHSGGFYYPSIELNDINIVLGFAYPLDFIFRKLLITLKKKRNFELLNNIQEEVKGNIYLDEIFRAELADDYDEPMEIDLYQVDIQTTNKQNFKCLLHNYKFIEEDQMEID